MNKARTVHTLHSSRATYIVISSTKNGTKAKAKAKVETFIVGHDIANGERLQWIVDRDKWKHWCCYRSRWKQKAEAISEV
jgi:predicted cupin superfamily sugar epimerase